MLCLQLPHLPRNLIGLISYWFLLHYYDLVIFLLISSFQLKFAQTDLRNYIVLNDLFCDRYCDRLVLLYFLITSLGFSDFEIWNASNTKNYFSFLFSLYLSYYLVYYFGLLILIYNNGNLLYPLIQCQYQLYSPLYYNSWKGMPPVVGEMWSGSIM